MTNRASDTTASPPQSAGGQERTPLSRERVLAGAIAGFSARGLEPSKAAVWGSWSHARAGQRLAARAGIGFLARELATELTAARAEVSD